MRKTIAVCCAVSMLAGCAGANYRPMIDSRNVDMNRYEADLRDCQGYAAQTAGAAEHAAVGAVAGALFGALLAAAAGSRYDAGASARVSAVIGATGSGFEGEKDQRAVITRCLANRGYSVLK